MRQAPPKAETAAEAVAYYELLSGSLFCLSQEPWLSWCLGQQDKCPLSVTAIPSCCRGSVEGDALAENMAATVLK